MHVRALFDIIMGLIYLVVGIFLAISKYIGLQFHFPPPDVATIFGVCSAAYGAFRIYRGIKTRKTE